MFPACFVSCNRVVNKEINLADHIELNDTLQTHEYFTKTKNVKGTIYFISSCLYESACKLSYLRISGCVISHLSNDCFALLTFSYRSMIQLLRLKIT